MLAESAKNLVPKFFDETGTTYDGVVSYGTLGKDRYWKKKILEQISDGSSFLDLACGTGILTRKIAEKFPKAKIVGIDITKSATLLGTYSIDKKSYSGGMTTIGVQVAF